ncbi:MAG: hypothetical protein JWR72_692 [Flavisolibacter sp.]|nr:hypothetical protein [Flavisolibacter sp.]
MIISKIQPIFQRWSLKQGLQICIARAFNKFDMFNVYEKLNYEDKKYINLLTLGYLLKKKGKYIQIEKEGLKVNKVLLRKQSSDIDVFIQIFVKDEFAGLFSLIDEKQKIKTVIDAGANVGISSVMFDSAFPNISIIAIEPDYDNFSLLSKNLSLNKINSVTEQTGIWNKKARLYFDRSFRDGKEWSITVTETPNRGPFIESLSINDIVDKYDLKTIDLLKIDIEGSEKQVFLDNDCSLDFLNKTRYIAIELHHEVLKENKIEKILFEKGFLLKKSGEYLIGKNQNEFFN